MFVSADSAAVTLRRCGCDAAATVRRMRRLCGSGAAVQRRSGIEAAAIGGVAAVLQCGGGAAWAAAAMLWRCGCAVAQLCGGAAAKRHRCGSGVGLMLRRGGSAARNDGAARLCGAAP